MRDKKETRCVYRHVRLDTNEVFYIGIGKKINRAYDIKNRNRWWTNITNKTSYRVDIIFEGLTHKEACEKEKELISLYGRRDLGLGSLVNLTDGGEGSVRYSHTEKTKKHLSSVRKGKKSHRKGMKLTKKHSTSILESRPGSGAGKPLTPVVRISPDGKIAEYTSLSEAAKIVSGFQSAITSCCKGLRKSHKGYKWKYKK